MKKRVRSLLHCLGFIGGFCLLLVFLSMVFVPKNNNAIGGLHVLAAKNISCEPEHSIDALIVGDSESYSAFIPLQIWEEHGITTYCCGTSGQNLSFTESILRHVFDTQSPKVVVLETNALYRKMKPTDTIMTVTEQLFPVFQFHHRWKSLSKDDLQLTLRPSFVENGKGYYYSKVVAAASTKGYMDPSEKSAPIPPVNRKRVEKINEYCKEQGAQLILLSSPSTKNWNMKRHNSVQQLAEELGVEYVDMNLFQEELQIDWDLDSRDSGDHLNYTGANKATRFLGQYLADTGLFQDKRGDSAFSRWNDFLEEFKDFVASDAK